jgi:hypothetical protein
MQHLLSSASFLVVLATSLTAQSLVPYGVGTKGSNSKTPAMWASTEPRPGASTFALLYEEGQPNAGAITVLSVKRDSIPVGSLTILVDLAAGLIMPAIQLDGLGKGRFPAAIPNSASIVGATVHTQGFVVDPGASVLGLSATQGLTLRVARPGTVVTQTSVIDLASGRVAALSPAPGNSYGGNFVPSWGSHVILIDTANKARMYDLGTFPPKYVGVASTTNPGFLQTMAVHPSGTMMYAVPTARSTLNPFIDVLWAVPALFGNAHPAKKIALGGFGDAIEMVCHPDGKLAYLGGLGLISGPGSVVRVDIDPASTTFHQLLPGSVSWPGRFVWGIDISRDGKFLYAGMGPLSGPSEVAVIDTATFTAIDFDAKRAGQQNLGGERSVPRTPIPVLMNNVRVGPRGHYIYTSHSRGIVTRIDIRSSSPTFRQVVLLQTPSKFTTNTRGLEISDAGDKLYFDGGSVYEINTGTMKILRTWKGASRGWHLTLR